MKWSNRSISGSRDDRHSISLALFTCLFLIMFSSCQKDNSDFSGQDSVSLKGSELTSNDEVYFGPVIFTRGRGEPVTETLVIGNQLFGCFENLVLKIENGSNKHSRVSSAEITIDGLLIAHPSDFSKKVSSLTIPLTGLTSESTLEVKLNGAPGSFIKLSIEGTLTLVTPVFTQIDPVVQDSEAPVLPAISENDISGTWSPATVSTSSAGSFTYTFTPDAGQCASVVTMVIKVTYRYSVADTEGNVYGIVKIGSQWWMAENLKTTKYNNGDLIGTTVPADQPIAEGRPKYQWAYDGIESRVNTLGRLYTWYTVTDSRGVCPTGWHVPSDAEWTTLTDYLTINGYGFEGSGDDIAKSLASKSEWLPNEVPGNVGNDPASNNSTGFGAVPGGDRLVGGEFRNMGYLGRWWSSDAGLSRTLYRNSPLMHRIESNTKIGSSVRCIKD